MKKASQELNILQYLLDHKNGLTSIQALKKFGCFRLASRVCALKKHGFPIHKETIKKNGKRYARYFIYCF